MVLSFFGIKHSQPEITQLIGVDDIFIKENGVPTELMVTPIYTYGLTYTAMDNAKMHHIEEYIDRGVPIIINYIELAENEGHFAVIIGYTNDQIFLNDPIHGEGFTIDRNIFESRWKSKYQSQKGWMLAVAP